MRPVNKSLFSIAVFCLVISQITGCAGKPSPIYVEETTAHPVKIGLSDSAFTEVNSLLSLDTYVILSPAVIVGNIQRIIVHDDLIYISDSEPKICCFDFKGNPVFQIASRGAGPLEFGTLVDFAVDPARNRLVLYDSGKRRLTFYDLKNGKFQSETSLRHLAPMKMGIKDGIFFFHNPYSYNYPDSDEYRYTLLYSFTGSTADGKFFPHDGIASEYHFSAGQEHPFYYNDGILLYNKLFDGVVYQLESGKIIPVYRIDLPNPLPLEKIKDRMDPMDLLESSYSSFLSDLYTNDSILYFTFNYNKYLISAFYDLKEDKTIYCGNRVNNRPTGDLPVYYPIRGVYNGCFFSAVSPSAVMEKAEIAPEVFPDDLKKITEQDNPVIMFYKVNRNR